MVAFRSLIYCATFLFSITAWSAELSLTLTDDATVTGNRTSANYGAITTIVVHDFGPKQGLVKFDGSSIAGETVQSATLSIYLNAISGSGTVTVHPITSGWDEGSVTWNTLPTYETTSVSSASLSGSDVGSFVTFDVTDTVQRWANGSLEPNGFLIQTTATVRATFQSKENSGGNPPSLLATTDDAPPPTGDGVGTPPVVLDLTSPPVIVDSIGHYVLDKDWSIDGLPTGSSVVELQANATLDMGGFSITFNAVGGSAVLVGADGGTVTNGRIFLEGEGTTGIAGVGRAIINNVTIRTAFDAFALTLGGALSQVTNSAFVSDNGVLIEGDYSSISACDLNCDDPCLWVFANDVSIRDNSMFAAVGGAHVFELVGYRNLFSNNTVSYSQFGAGIGVEVEGNGNLILGNTFRYSSVAIEIDGANNVAKDNIQLAGIGSIGINFLQDGNYYQNNLVSATVPFELNGTVQTDLGGNVGY